MRVFIRLHGDLVDLVEEKRWTGWRSIEFLGKRSIKDLIQSMGIPHTEVGRIYTNDSSLKIDDLIDDDQKLDIYPFLPGASVFDLNPVQLLCDVHLWKLTRRLRLLGFDTQFNPKWDDAELAELCFKENLVLLSRDRGLLKRNKIKHGLLIRNTDPEKQVFEVLQRLKITDKAMPFTRCLLCNGKLETKNENQLLSDINTKSQIPEKILKEWKVNSDKMMFCQCHSCGKVFWQGSHYKKLKNLITNYLT